MMLNASAPTQIYTLSLHDALPILAGEPEQVISPARPITLPLMDLSAMGQEEREAEAGRLAKEEARRPFDLSRVDRKSTRLNSSHLGISYAVFCLKKKKKTKHTNIQ